MATLMALARGLSRQRPARGRAVLLFQPAEENGAGAAAVLADPRFGELAPDYAFALHNLPGLPLGRWRWGRAGELRLARHAHRPDGQDRSRLDARARDLADGRGRGTDAGSDRARSRRSADEDLRW